MGESTPICRCRVLYLGSAVPRQSKDGLQGIQEPLRGLYPSEGALGAKGIDSWLSVWSNGILLENVDENLKQITRFFPIESLHYCAAVRQVLIPERGSSSPEPKFLPLDSPFARMPRAHHPPIFAAILRRTTGIKVLECHVFICKREAAANALVRCCFHAYADNSYARQLETGSTVGASRSSVYGTLQSTTINKSCSDLTNVGDVKGNHIHNLNHGTVNNNQGGWRSRVGSTMTLNSLGRQSNGNNPNNVGGLNVNKCESNDNSTEGYTSVKHIYDSNADLNVNVEDGESSLYNDDENHKVWNGSQDQLDSITGESPYEVFSNNSSTMGRPMRARQISVPIDVPPPPLKDDTKNKNDAKILKSSATQSLSGTLIRPKPIHLKSSQRLGLHGPLGTGNVIYGPVTASQIARPYHTISHRSFHPGSQFLNHSLHHSRHRPGLPGPPLLHPQHLNGAHAQMSLLMPQQYATLQSRSTKKKKSDKKYNGIPLGMPIMPPMYAYHTQNMGPPPPFQSVIGEPRSLAMSNQKLAVSMGNGLDEAGNSGAESPSGTGIYRRKGHLNERAFSYSIRQEHRSRSHGSLASIQFNTPDLKKEREIAQMVAGLDLHDAPERQIGSNHAKLKHASLTNGASDLQTIYSDGGAAGIYGSGKGHTTTFSNLRR